MSRQNSTNPERERLELFRARPGGHAPRDTQDLMAYPFFSLAKTPRIIPIDFQMGDVSILVEAVPEYGMATIWDADVLIWAASQIVEARDLGLATSRLMVATPHEILTFIGRGTSARDYQRLKAALDRLQSTTVATSLYQPRERRTHRFSWINEWTERASVHGRSDGIDLILPDWFYCAVLDNTLILTIDPAYFKLKGGLERWLYRLVRKHAGRQRAGWRFDFRHLHFKSACLSSFKCFAFELRAIARRQPLPGYFLAVESDRGGNEILAFKWTSLSKAACGQPVDSNVLSHNPGDVPATTGAACDQQPKPHLSHCRRNENRPPNFISNRDSNLTAANRPVDNSGKLNAGKKGKIEPDRKDLGTFDEADCEPGASLRGASLRPKSRDWR